MIKKGSEIIFFVAITKYQSSVNMDGTSRDIRITSNMIRLCFKYSMAVFLNVFKSRYITNVRLYNDHHI